MPVSGAGVLEAEAPIVAAVTAPARVRRRGTMNFIADSKCL